MELFVPIFWTALNIALGYQVQGDQVIRGLPCIKRLRQLFCTNAGSQYPTDQIESFISENKALTRRMFGMYPPPSPHFAPEQFPRKKRSTDNSTETVAPSEAHRARRQAVPSPPVIDKGSKHLVDSCESKVEIVTPYWAANSAGEIRAIVNTKHFPQAIHQEICKGTTTSRCTGNCLCEQKYTYHRLLSYDPDNNCKGIFIDWFLFPSCCACRCPP